MPQQPPRFRPPGWRPSEPWATSKGKSRQERGYGADHDAIRKQVLIEEPYCRQCIADGVTPPRRTACADHISNRAEGGQNVRANYQGLCWPHHKAKTAREAARSRRSASGPAGV
ncbi:endonuclease [Sphingobium indicum IP26]|uniref:Endonuclease n=1 Tax=Sphingobium indicum F2 TaxID=1450518 RepID=A0A8E0WSP5_9SPHN|nr:MULTISPECIES: HNH endonuclease signature motif containing protein [Sphingobium]EPR09632.1 endonuclease [Sphingobium indicum IP26]EQB04851.1 endonuclease [Sphingobium sp. HDIP04]KER36677.1 endonuclease [Sphingobium indicum F2]